jgi:hypothetical protein
VEEGHVVLQRQGLLVWARPAEIATTGGATAKRGTPVTVHLPKERLCGSPGFYVALGNNELPQPRSEPILRLYWNIRANAAPRLMRDATTKLNNAEIPFRLKMVSDPGGYPRCDAAVLYLPKRFYLGAAGIVSSLHHESRDDIGDAVPALTKQLAPGLGLAEDPGDGDSFGMHRCRLVAEGIIRAHEYGMRSIQKRIAAVVTCFTEAGIDGDYPYLNPGSVDGYPPLKRPTR